MVARAISLQAPTVWQQEGSMQATGTFEVELSAQDDAEAPVGRMLMTKTYVGDLNAR